MSDSSIKLINEIKEFYEEISTKSMDFTGEGVLFGYLNLSTNIFKSMEGSIESIMLLIEKKRLNDGYAICRLYYDHIVLHCFLMLKLNRINELDGEIMLEFDRSIEKKLKQYREMIVSIEKWLSGNKELSRYVKMTQYISKSSEIPDILKTYMKSQQYIDIRNRCEDSLHLRQYQSVLNNNSSYVESNQSSMVNQLEKDMYHLFNLHFTFVSILYPHYFSSSDYMDALEAGLEPEEGSSEWVAPFCRDIFIKSIKRYDKDLYNIILRESSLDFE